MIKIVHNNKIDKSPQKTYSKTIIDSKSGCKNLIQSILYLKDDSIIFTKTEKSQKIAYILSGKISLITEQINNKLILESGTAFLIDQNIKLEIKNLATDYSSILIIQSPQFENQNLKEADIRNPSQLIPFVNKKDQSPLPAGKDRYFKLLIDPKFGSKYVTQFLGYIKKVKAPFHEHTYEEVIYIIKGEGIVHYDDKKTIIKEGNSVYLPPGTMHRLENKNSKIELELIGVFCPAGSPADKKENPNES